jgi:aromatic ring-opening dioxygenase catalytic subunit (LigB family)
MTWDVVLDFFEDLRRRVNIRRREIRNWRHGCRNPRSFHWRWLRHVYPAADVPVLQLSIGERVPLRKEGALIVGSGNLVHNLRAYDWGGELRGLYDWAARFEAEARGMMAAGEVRALVEYQKLGRDAAMSIPTPGHYLPLLYVLATQQAGEKATRSSDSGFGRWTFRL